MLQILANLTGLALTWAIWLWLFSREFSLKVDLGIAIGGALGIIPLVFAGRWLLDRQPDAEHARRVTAVVHYLVGMLLGSAIGCAARLGQQSQIWPLPLPPWLGLGVMALGGAAFALVVFNLAVKGLGAPFAIALTRVVATEWAYEWTRNPMILSALAFLVGLGLWMGSGLFLVWLLVVVSPAILVYLAVYEERELEIRFGQDYLDYKRRTPRFLRV